MITGGAMGQGKAHALKYAQNGFDVVLADMQDPEGETFKATVAEIEAAGAKALAVKCNICSDEDMQNLFAKAWETFGRLDVVIANAGVINFGYTWELTDAQVEKVINIDLTGKDFKNGQEMYKVAWAVATRLPNSSQPSSVFG